MDRVSEFITESLEKVLSEELKSASSDEEIQDIIEKFNKIDLGESTGEILLKMSQEVKDDYKANMYEVASDFRLIENEFLARHEYKWNSVFTALETFYVMIMEAIEHYTEYVEEIKLEDKKDKTALYIALLHVQGRAMQQFLEITSLIKNGFADGAFARWRSMYELNIIANFISTNGENTAEAFIKSADTNDRYEWAKQSEGLISKGKYVTFNDIQKSVDIYNDTWKRQYDLANKVVHASPQGTFGRLSNMNDEKNLIPIGRSDYGVDTAAEHSAISLAQITTLFLGLFHHGDSIVATGYINEWVSVIQEYCQNTKDEIFSSNDN